MKLKPNIWMLRSDFHKQCSNQRSVTTKLLPGPALAFHVNEQHTTDAVTTENHWITLYCNFWCIVKNVLLHMNVHTLQDSNSNVWWYFCLFHLVMHAIVSVYRNRYHSSGVRDWTFGCCREIMSKIKNASTKDPFNVPYHAFIFKSMKVSLVTSVCKCYLHPGLFTPCVTCDPRPRFFHALREAPIVTPLFH